MATRNLWRSFLLALLLAWPFRAQVTAASPTYTDPSGRFSFMVPEGYSVQILPTVSQTPFVTIVVASLSRSDARVNVTVLRNAAAGDGNSGRGDACINSGPSGAVVSNPPFTTLGGQPARSCDWFSDDPRGRIHNLTLGAMYGFFSYTCRFEAAEKDYDALLAETQIMRDSFVFLDDGTTTAIGGPSSSASDNPPITYPYQFLGWLDSQNARVVLMGYEDHAFHLRMDCLRSGEIADASVSLLLRATQEEFGAIGPFSWSCGEQRMPMGAGSIDLTSVVPGQELTLVREYKEDRGDGSFSSRSTFIFHIGIDGRLHYGTAPPTFL